MELAPGQVEVCQMYELEAFPSIAAQRVTMMYHNNPVSTHPSYELQPKDTPWHCAHALQSTYAHKLKETICWLVQVFMFLFDKSGKLLHANQRALDHYCGATDTCEPALLVMQAMKISAQYFDGKAHDL